MKKSLPSNFFKETKQALIYTFSNHIGLRNWSPADCWPEQIAMNDPECRHMFSAEGPPSNIEEYLEDQKTLLGLEEDNIGLSVAITEKLTGKWLGYCLFRLDPTVQNKLVLERTLFLIPQVWGAGITQELDSLTKTVLFNKGVSAISHYVKLENERAMKSLLKQGLTTVKDKSIQTCTK